MGEKSHIKDVKIFEALWSLAPHIAFGLSDTDREKGERDKKREKKM